MVNTLKGFRKWRSLKGSDMAALIGKRSSVMGKFWDGCSKDDEDKLYPCVIKEYDDRKKIARIAALQQMATEDEPEAGEEAPVPLTKEEVRQKKAPSRKAPASACFTAPQLVKYVTENNGKSLLAVNKWTCLDNFTAGDPPCGRMLIDERARRRAAQRPHREAMFKVFKKLALYTTKESTKFNEAMKAAQRACGIVSEPQPALNMLNPADTRHDGAATMLERAIEIEPALRMTLKKTHADLRGDEIIDGELDEAAVEETASIVSSDDEIRPRSTPKKERKDRFEFKAGLDGEKHFSALQFYSKLRMRAPVHAAMAQQIFADEATEAVSERSFSIHSLYTSKLRKALQGKVIAPMLRCKANHDLFFEEIKAKIYERYFRKYRNNVDAFPYRARPKDDADDDVAN
ncbi:hypothetical protein JL721_12862 [Aureococcus anophagefferens]|nr:hypothetical protein JL721_12862 [Aureococcus anophagefferens]